jgi:ubiquinone/menaquinone biosynthesis C-methylase UbiE
MDSAEFDRFADEYEQLHAANIRASGETPAFFAKYKVDDVAATMRTLGRVPARILDFGGGVGNSLGFMLESFPDSDIVLLDPSSRSLDIARGRYPSRASFMQFDGKTIPFPDGSFDLAFAACVFHHIPADQHVSMLRELARVLAPGGSLFIFEHNPWNPLTVRAVKECPFDDNAVLINAREIRRRICVAGFTTGRIAYRLFFPRFLRGLRPIERYLSRLPLGAQYYVHSIKGD